MKPERYMELRALADQLIASCNGGYDKWDAINELSVEECQVLDTMALECCDCNQYFEASQMHDLGNEYQCPSCHG